MSETQEEIQENPRDTKEKSSKSLTIPIWARLVFCIILTASVAFAGKHLAKQHGSHFVHPRSINRDIWHVVSPGMNESMDNPTLGRGTHVVDGALTLSLIAFHASDKLSFDRQPDLKEVEFLLAPDSGQANIKLMQDIGNRNVPVVLGLEPKRFSSLPNSSWITTKGTGSYRLLFKEDGVYVLSDGHEYKMSGPQKARLEITAIGSDLRIFYIKAVDVSGNVLIEEDYRTWAVDSRLPGVGMLWGLFVGIAMSVILLRARNPILALLLMSLLIIPPLRVGSLPLSIWIEWVERLYLGKTQSFILAQVAFCIAWFPLFFWSLLSLRMGLQPKPEAVDPKEGSQEEEKAEVSIPQNEEDIPAMDDTATVVASEQASEASVLQNRWFWGILILSVVVSMSASRFVFSTSIIPGVLFVALPARIAVQKGIPSWKWLLWDVPAMGMLAALGWEYGFFPAVLWRILILSSSVSFLRHNHARATADSLFFLLLCIPLSLEILIRSSYLDQAWRIENLSFQFQTEDGEAFVARTWKGECGPEESAQNTSLLYVGGSSTGGIKQFRERPEMFFSGQAHGILCDRKAPEQSITTYNYGRGALDTHLIAQTFSQVLKETQPNWVVAYIGVNDLLTQEHPLTRKEREELMKNWRSGLTTIQNLTSQSRLFVGGGLFLRTPTPITKVVSNVPPQDARWNIQSMITKLRSDQRMLLITEYIQPRLAQSGEVGSSFVDYTKMLQELAQQDDRAEYLDAWPTLRGYPTDDILVDSNHMTQKGNRILGESIAERLEKKILSQPKLDSLNAE
ncbi:MAG: SGNH/GDSL hydrolase family protein [Myxococcota bacterium]|nr:SGNH/GDSL hydrolase family protein [Myxococcota bacterium]